MTRIHRDAKGVAEHAEAAVDRAASGNGAPLRADLRDRFESSLGADLSGVRLHTGGASAEASAAVGARAYTVGNDIHFGAGQYQPDDPFGVHLLAHEVAHTVQQAGSTPHRQHKLEVSSPGDAAEVEADRAASAMVAGTPFTVGSAAGGTVNRQPKDNSYNRGEIERGGNKTALGDEEIKAWAADKQRLVGLAEGLVKTTTGFELSLGDKELMKKLEADAKKAIKHDLSTREGEIAWLEQQHDNWKAKNGAFTKLNLQAAMKQAEYKRRLDEAKADHERRDESQDTRLEKTVTQSRAVVSTLKSYVSTANEVADSLQVHAGLLKPEMFDTAKARLEGMDKALQVANFASKLMDRAAFDNFRNAPSYDTAKAWARQVTNIMSAMDGFTAGLPPGFDRVVSAMTKMPGIITEKFIAIMDARYAAIDAETHVPQGKLLDEGTSG